MSAYFCTNLENFMKLQENAQYCDKLLEYIQMIDEEFV